MGSVKDTVKQWMNSSEIAEAEELSQLWVLGIKTLRGSLSRTLRAAMDEQHLSFNEVARELDVSENMVSKMLYGKGSVNFDTIVRVAKLTKKVPYIAWKDPDDVDDKDFPVSKTL